MKTIPELQAALDAHLTRRPVSPGAVDANSPEMIRFHKALTLWVKMKHRLEGKIESSQIARTESLERAPIFYAGLPKRVKTRSLNSVMYSAIA